MLTRRSFLAAIAASHLAHPAHAALPEAAWAGWRSRYLDAGRVIDWQQHGISHSEGQGYGLMLAQAAGDREGFEQIETWTRQHLAVRDDRLMAWSWREDGRTDWRNATDGDLFRAWALLRAHRDSGWTGYLDKALAIAHDIATLCLAADPRAPTEWLLLPGAEARRTPDRVLLNPSYIMPRALRELGEAAGDIRLIRAAVHGETVLAELAGADQLWNWIDITATGFAPPSEHRAGWGYDALRIPLYLIWSGRGGHPAVNGALRLLEEGAHHDHLVVTRTKEGWPEVQSNQSGFLALPRLARCKPLPERASDAASYYPDTLLMLCRLALREGNCAL